MSTDGTWYYAQNNNKYGPINSAQLKSLVENGQLQKTDLVWKEGMDDWKPAGKIAGLFGQESAAPVAAAPSSPPAVGASSPATASNIGVMPEPKRSARMAARNNPFDFMEVLKPFGSIVLLAGLVLVIFSRGCDSINARGLVSMRAQAEEAGRPDPDENENAMKNRLETRDKLLEDVEQTRTLNQRMGFWLEVLFVLGTVCFSLGLLVSGFTGEGAGRWISMVMLAIIVFSIYIGGTAWMATLTSLMPSF